LQLQEAVSRPFYLPIVADCKTLDSLKKNAIILHTRVKGVEQLHYWLNLHVDNILAFGLRPVLTSCIPDYIEDTALVLYDAHGLPIYRKYAKDITHEIWDDIHNLMTYRTPLLVIKEGSVDLGHLMLYDKVCVAIIAESFYVDNSLRFYEWVNNNREESTVYAFMIERLNDGFEGHLLKTLGHFRHIPNESKIRLVCVERKPSVKLVSQFL
jgi:hypothetical protein